MIKNRLMILVTFLLLTTNSFAGPLDSTQEAAAVKGEFIVKIKNGQEESFKAKLEMNSFSSMVSKVSNLGLDNSTVYKITLNTSASAFAANADLKAMYSEIELVEPNYIYKMQLQTPDLMDNLANLAFGGGKKGKGKGETKKKDMFDQLWGLKNTGDNEPADSRGNNTSVQGIAGVDISAEAAWKIFKENHVVKVAVIDTGVDYRHPDLVQNIMVNENEIPDNGIDDDDNGYIDDFYGYDFLNIDNDPMDDHGHGTHCSGTIGALHNDFGIRGVIANVKILPIKFLGPNGGSLEGAIKSIDYATSREVDIMSNSWGGGGKSQLLQDAIQRASDAGIVFTAAAGNSATNNDSRPSYPANYEVENVISVAAHNYGNKLASFSQYGKKTVHIAAPGRNILSTTAKTRYTDNKKYNTWSGTSMATPHVSGAIALLIAQEGRMDVGEVKHRLMETSIDKEAYSAKVGSGRLDAERLLENVRN